MKQTSSRMGMVSAMLASILSSAESQYMLSGLNPRSPESIAARIGSYTPRQSSPIRPSRRFRSKDEANQLKNLAALRREQRAVKRYSQYLSTLRGVTLGNHLVITKPVDLSFIPDSVPFTIEPDAKVAIKAGGYNA